MNTKPLWKDMLLAATDAVRNDTTAADTHLVAEATAAEIRAVAERLENKRSELLATGHELTVEEAVRWLGYEAERAEAGR